MRSSDLKSLLSAMFRARQPVLITSAPGVGKTSIVMQAAEAIGANLIITHPAVADPTDIKGLPWVVDGMATFIPFGDLRAACTATKPTVWLHDDLGQAPPSVQAGDMQLFLQRQVNDHKLSDHVTMVAATNRRTDRAGVSGILEPVKSRFCTIVELEANIDDWCKWAIDADIAPEIIAFLRFQPDLLCKFSPTADLSNSPVPRTWANAATILSMNLPPHVQHAAICGAVGEGAGVEFAAFLKVCRALPSIDQILIDPSSVPVPSEPSILYALAGALAHRTTDQNFGRVAQFIERMVTEGRGEFGVLTIRDAMQRHPKITETQAFVKLATGEFGSLIFGDKGAS